MLRSLSLFTVLLSFVFAISASAKPRLLFVPGYYGSKLVTKADNEVIWLSTSELIFGNNRLNLCNPAVEHLGCLDLKPGPVLDEISVIPFIFSVDIYKPAIEALKKIAGEKFDFEIHTYDWRRSPKSLAKELTQKLLDDQRPTYIVAHSYGGVLISALMLDHQTKKTEIPSIRGISLVGVPQKGSVQSLGNLIRGRQRENTGTLLDPLSFGTFASVYHLLPWRDKILYDQNGVDISKWINKPRRWKENKWGVYSDEKAKPKLAAKFIRRNLESINKMRTLLKEDIVSAVTYSVINFRSRGKATRVAYGWDTKEMVLTSPKGGEYVKKGDGTVPWSSAKFPRGLAKLLQKDVELQSEHLEILNESEFLTTLREDLQMVFGGLLKPSSN